MNKVVAILAGMGSAALALVWMDALCAQDRSGPDGAALFAENCAACHGSDGASGERAPDIVRRREVVALTDEELTRIVGDGLPGTGMPGFRSLGGRKISALVAHLRTLQGVQRQTHIPGDARRGEQLFFGKAECGRCHMVNGQGGFLGSDLSGFGQSHSESEIREAILNPDARLDRGAQRVAVIAKDGARWEGRIRSEDNFSLVLQTDDGAFRFFDRDRLGKIEYSGHSSMPRDYKTRLGDRELDDILSYILTAKSEENTTPGKDDDE